MQSSIAVFLSSPRPTICLDTTVENDQAAVSATAVEHLLETLGADLLPLWEGREREWQRDEAHGEDEAEVDGRGVAGVAAQPFGAL